MTSRSPRGSRLLLALAASAAAACGGSQGAAPAAPTTSTVTSEPTTPVTGTPPGPDGPAAPVAAAAPKAPGPNFTPDGVVFNYKPERKGKVFLAGSFNNWNPSNEQFVLKDDDGDGMWSITVKLVPGSYQYKFVIDGTWYKDPHSPSDAPDGFGGRNGKFDVR
jgi:Glycogen recognition site of AMP-activated protein kinase